MDEIAMDETAEKARVCPFCHESIERAGDDPDWDHAHNCALEKVGADSIVSNHGDDILVVERYGTAWIMTQEVDDDGMARITSCVAAEQDEIRRFMRGIMRGIQTRQASMEKLSALLARRVALMPRTLVVHVEGGLAQGVYGLPDRWSYTVDDRDACPTCGTTDVDCVDCGEEYAPR